MDFNEFCDVMEVEPTGEYEKLFRLFDHDASGKIDVKEFMMGLNNFSGTDKASKIDFAFSLFDDDNNGFITMDELIHILKANHMASDDKQVLKKANTIMRQADKDGDNKINIEEFHVIAEKFPNILFPAYKVSDELMAHLG